MLGRQLDRARRARRIDSLVVATSTHASDDPIAAFCAAEGFGCWRGDLDDVLGRFVGAVRACGPCDHVVRLTGDCPLIDPTVIDQLVEHHVAAGYDYSSNFLDRTYPDGLDAEIATTAAFLAMADLATTAYDREHVTPYFYNHADRFRLGSISRFPSLGALRWTVDTDADFRMVSAVFAELLPVREDFTYFDVLDLLQRRTDIASINSPD
jgi:spore coat polysaccharide biosynthesis protein SpsF